MRILVSGGGTAGHISPILATLDALKSSGKSAEILYVGQKGSMEAKITASLGVQFAAVSAGKYRRYHNAKLLHKLTDLSTLALNMRDLGRLGLGIRQSLKIIKQFDPDVIFLKGGYVALPVGIAARIAKVPFVIHESDVRMGLSNRILSRWASAIATGFPIERYPDQPAAKLHFTGNPIRMDLLKAHRLEGLAAFKLETKLPVVLVFGGSGGAQRINDALIQALPELTKRYQIVHIAGERDIERVRFEVKRIDMTNPGYYHPYSYLSDDMGSALAVSDVVVSRAGANSIAELAALGKPTILIPASHLSDQPLNAQVLARAGAVRVIQESRLTREVLCAEIDRVLTSEEEQAILSKHIREFAVLDAADKLARLITEHAREPKPTSEPTEDD